MQQNIKNWLLERGISESVIAANKLSFENNMLIIPIFDEVNSFLFNKYRRSPFASSDSAPKYTYDRGATAQLYMPRGVDRSAATVFIVEGELDALLLASRGFFAVSSTGGAGTFKKEWGEVLSGRKIYICYDNDTAGVKGTVRLLNIFPEANVIEIPKQKDCKDISDYLKLYPTGLEFLIGSAERWRLPPLFDAQASIKEIKARRGLCRFLAEDMQTQKHERQADGRSTELIDLLLEEVSKRYDDYSVRIKHPSKVPGDSDALLKAKAVPIKNYIKFNAQRKALCIWHQEKTPSMIYYPKDNRVKCYGCGKLGDVIDVVQEMFLLNKGEAIKKINNEYA